MIRPAIVIEGKQPSHGSPPRIPGNPAMPLSEEQLVKTLLHEQAKLCGLIRLIVRNGAAVEDVFQEVSIKAVTHRDEITDELHLARWLRTVARNEAINWAKRESRSPLVFSD